MNISFDDVEVPWTWVVARRFGILFAMSLASLLSLTIYIYLFAGKQARLAASIKGKIESIEALYERRVSDWMSS